MAELVSSAIEVERYIKEAFHSSCGAVSVFLGVVRDHSEGKEVTHLEYEAYEPVALKAMTEIEEELTEKYKLRYMKIVHRTGRLQVGEVSLLVVASAPHRRETMRAVEECVNLVKKRVPVWKKEFFKDGTSSWTKGEVMEVKDD